MECQRTVPTNSAKETNQCLKPRTHEAGTKRIWQPGHDWSDVFIVHWLKKQGEFFSSKLSYREALKKTSDGKI